MNKIELEKLTKDELIELVMKQDKIIPIKEIYATGKLKEDMDKIGQALKKLSEQ